MQDFCKGSSNIIVFSIDVKKTDSVKYQDKLLYHIWGVYKSKIGKSMKS